MIKSKSGDISPICASLGINWRASAHGVVGRVLVERFVFDNAAPSERSDKPGPGSAAELGIDGTDDDVI